MWVTTAGLASWFNTPSEESQTLWEVSPQRLSLPPLCLPQVSLLHPLFLQHTPLGISGCQA